MSVLRVPGDKSISHRALLLAALGDGPSEIRGLLVSADVEATARALRALGVAVPPLDATVMVVPGVGLRGLRAPTEPIDCANSGTTARLVAGLVAGAGLDATLVGDVSLSRRPMRRIAEPLRAMGATVALPSHDGLPMTVRATALHGLTWRSPVASAQVKSAVLLAGLVAQVPVEVHEPQPTRDHTERLLASRGVDLVRDSTMVALRPTGRLDAGPTDVPGDPSSATFLLGAVALGAASTLRLEHIGVNPTRMGAVAVLRRMGLSVRLEGMRQVGGEPVADLVATSVGDLSPGGSGGLGGAPSALLGVTIGPDEVPVLIDELPLLACVAARAAGETRVTGAGELRVKESDRIRLVVENLQAVGVEAEELADGFVIRGGDGPLAGRVRTAGDHRIAMAFGVLGAVPGNAIVVDDPSCVAVSWPSFWDALDACRR
ncbi:MAG: 3-phosphoshikimate 1-carboxyvinyltransferase [Gemmatimonadetes bacterium]|nr:3-phosphoshikimate 1-carboxyvinyltransferase [Gemmatimonadota bacterium]